MPLYEYRCKQCGHVFEKIQSYSAPDGPCPRCAGEVERLLSAPAIQFKGSGFYLTDYGKSGGAPKGGNASDSGASPSGDSSKSSGDSKAAPASGGASDSSTASKPANPSSASPSSSSSPSGSSSTGSSFSGSGNASNS